MTGANKVPGNWLDALKMADDVEVVAVAALERILELVGSEYLGQKLIDARESEYRDLVLCNPERVTEEIMKRERKIRDALRMLEENRVGSAMTRLREP